MRTEHLLGLAGVCLIATWAAPGCGGTIDVGNTGGGTAASVTASRATATTAVSSSASGTGGGGGTGGFAGATDIAIDGPVVSGTLSDPLKSQDYYKFSGTKDQAIGIRVQAQTLVAGGSGFDSTVIDPVIVLYGAAQMQIAMQDDQWPRFSKDPTLRTLLPADGDYYVMVEECNAHTPGACGDPTQLKTLDYQVNVYSLTGTADLPEGSEPDDDPAHATAMIYPYSGGQFINSFMWGTFNGPSDVDVYGINLPASTAVSAGSRPRVRIWVQPSSVNGNGSTSPVGKLWLVDPAAPAGKHLAEIDDTVYGIKPTSSNPPAYVTVPLSLATQYYLFVQHPAAAAGSHDFYFLTSWEHGGNSLEAQETANDTPAGAEPLAVTDNKDGTFNYYPEGDIAPAGTDVDHFSFDVPAGVTQTYVTCWAQREGSGLRGLQGSLLLPNGTPIGSFTEAPDKEVGLKAFPLPAGQSKLLIKVEAASQDPNVTGAFYRCNLFLRP